MPATDGPQYPPNPKLRAARQQRNWTLSDAARELRTLMVSRGEAQVGVNLHHVSRWERGERRPGMRHRHYLCMLYGLRADQLGFLPSDYVKPTLDPQADQAAQSETDGHAPQPGFKAGDLEQLNLTRRKLLAASGLLGGAVSIDVTADALARTAERLEHAAAFASGRAAADDALIRDLDTVADALSGASRRVSGDVLIGPTKAHLDMVKSVLGRSLLPGQRERLLAIASRTALLMTGAAFFDRRDHKAAKAWLVEAFELGEATSDPSTHVQCLLRGAEIGIYTGQSQKSLRLLDHARTLATRSCSLNTLSRVFTTQAEAFATLRQSQQCAPLLDLAAEAQQRSRPGDETPWTEHWGPSNVAGYVGAVHMRLEQPGKARVGLRAALAAADPSEIKLRSICLVDLAITYAQDLEAEAACEIAGKALDIAGPLHYGTTLERMADLRRRLAPLPKVGAVRDLEDRLRALKPV